MIAVLLVDAVSRPLLEQMMDEGRLPTLAALRARGTWRIPRAPMTYFGDRETLHTGVEVAEHGQTFPHQWSAAEQRLRDYTSFPAPPAIWDRVAAAGLRPLVVDPYEGRRPLVEGGLVVSGWQYTHPSILRRWSAPRSAYARLSRRHGRSPVVEDVYGAPSRHGLERLRRQVLPAPERIAALALAELARRSYDLVWLEFSAGHQAGHHFWDLSAVELPADRRRELEATVAETYVAMDDALARVVAALPRDADIVVLSETGMAASASRTDLLPEMLARVLAGTRSAGETMWQLRAAVPSRVRMALTRALPDPVVHDLAQRLFLRGVDWSRTRAFVLPSDHDGFIRFNLRGRERDGIVDPADAGALADEIVTGLETFVDPDGLPCVARVDRVADLVGEGPGSHLLPDLVVSWAIRPALLLPGVTSPAFGDVRRLGLGLGRSGNHVDEPWLLTVPGAARPVDQGENEPRLVDVAATVAALLGLDRAGLAGRPLLAA